MGAYYFCNTLFLSEQKSFDDAKLVDLEMNASAVSAIVSFVFNDLVSQVKYIATEVSNGKKEPTKEELKKIFHSFTERDMPIIDLGFFDDAGTLKVIYPLSYSNEIGNNYAFRDYFQKAKKLNKLEASKTLKNFKPKGTETDMDSFVIIKPVLNKLGKRFGFVFIDVDVDSIADSIQLNKYVKTDTNIKFYIVNPEYDNIICSPDKSLQAGKLSTEWLENIRKFIIKASKFPEKNNSKLVGVGNDKIYVTTSKVDVKEASLVVVAAVPYVDTINYSADFVRKVLLISVATSIMLMLFILLIVYQKTVVKKLNMQIRNLKIIIDKRSTKSEAEQITQSDYFKNLNRKVKKLKNKNG